MPNNKVTYGLKKVHIAFMPESGTWETPISIPGAVRFTPTAQGQESTFYADDSPYFVITANNGYTAELEMSLVPDSVLARMLGWEIDTNGMLVEVANAIPEPFALMAEVSGDANNRRFVYYDCIASRPAKEHTTKGESITPTTDILNLTIMPIEIGGKTIVRGVLELSDTNTAVYNAFYDSVVIPDATPAEVVKTQLAAAIALAETLVEEEYTVDSWSALAAALSAATSVNENGSATQAQVNAAEKALEEAILALVAA